MTLSDIDADLALWRKNLSAAAQNLMDLHDMPTYHRLAGSNGAPKVALEGVTAERVYPALDEMGKLLQYFDTLQDTIDRAGKMRQEVSPFFGSDQKLREIEHLLRGKSVRLPAVTVPIGHRTLAASGDNVECVTPAELMNAMSRSFTVARDVVVAVDSAWEKLGTELGACHETFPVLEQLRLRAEADPLGALDPVLEQIQRFTTLRVGILSGLAAAHKKLKELTDLHRESVACWEDRCAKVTCTTEPVPPQNGAQAAAFGEWLGRLEEKFHGGMLDPIAVGLKSWNKAAGEFVSNEGAALKANRAPLLERNELRGRLEALKAKARALGYVEHSELTRLADEAAKLLFQRPTPMEKAAGLVRDYERVLREQRHE
jgi:hypothetical protein